MLEGAFPPIALQAPTNSLHHIAAPCNSRPSSRPSSPSSTSRPAWRQGTGPSAGGDSKEEETVVKLPACGHMFHRECIVPWFERCDTCPMCRRVVTANGCARGNNKTETVEVGGEVEAVDSDEDEVASAAEEEEADGSVGGDAGPISLQRPSQQAHSMASAFTDTLLASAVRQTLVRA